MSLVTAALCCSTPALAQDRDSTSMPLGFNASGLTLLVNRDAEDVSPGRSENPHVTFGREQDIVGIPVSLIQSGGPKAFPGSPGSAGLPGIAVMPNRLPLAGATMTGRFGVRRHPIYRDLRSHSGIDLAAPTGTPVYATSAGYVGFADWWGGYGLLIAIAHPGGMQTRYGHLSRLAVAQGQYVEAGTVVGFVGSTGDSTGPHLHYEIRVNGRPINPLGH
jgi:murein DD-endopeptidase MepM/ murein hydrolase activator NlpD